MTATGQCETVVFLHIPKTAGTSFNTILSWQYGHRQSFMSPSADPTYWDEGKGAINQLSKVQQADLALVRGHMRFGVDELLLQSCTYITFLRNPVDRFISHYYHALQEGAGAPLHDAVDASDGLRDFIASGRAERMLNLQVRMIAGADIREECSAAMLDSAKQNIDSSFTLAGLTERFDESIALMKAKLNWRRPLFYFRSKVGAKRKGADEPSAETLTMIREANAMDIALYEWAAERLAGEVEANAAVVAREVEKIKRHNRLADRFLKHPLQLARRVRR